MVRTESEVQKRWPSSADLAMIIGIPFLSTGLVLLLLAFVCVKRLQKSTTPSPSLTPDPSCNVKGTMGSTHSSSHHEGGPSTSTLQQQQQGGDNWVNTNTMFAHINSRGTVSQSIYSQPMLNPRIRGSTRGWPSPSPSLRIYDNPTVPPNLLTRNAADQTAAGGEYCEIGQPNSKGQGPVGSQTLGESSEGGLTWVEVSNRECQTPSNWAFSNMTLESHPSLPHINNFRGSFDMGHFVGLATDYSLPKDTAGRLLPTLKMAGPASMQNSPIMANKARLNHYYQNIGSQQRSVGAAPPPPPYVPLQPQRHLSANLSKDIKSASSTPTSFANVRKFTSLESHQSEAGGSRQLLLPKKQSFEHVANLKDSTTAKQPPRSPSDHFYFKIYDGKTEFI